MRNEGEGGDPAFACCSVGIGRWFWVAWASEAEAKGLAPALASGYEKSAILAEAKALERFGDGARRLPAKWASAYSKGGKGKADKSSGTEGGPGEREARPKSRFGRPQASTKRGEAVPRLAFLYAAIARESPDSLGHVAVTRHRIVKQGARKIHVEREPFDEEEWARRSEPGEGSPGIVPRPRTLAVDRFELRKEGRVLGGRSAAAPTFYASEEDGIRDVQADLTARYAWCAALGVRFPCSTGDIKAAYRRLAFASHPDRGGDPAEFRSVERAYREALAYFGMGDEATG